MKITSKRLREDADNIAHGDRRIYPVGSLLDAADTIDALRKVLREREERFFLAQDDSCHWYLIPDSCRAEWEVWANIPSGDERSWEVPDFARSVGGPHAVTFTDPE